MAEQDEASLGQNIAWIVTRWHSVAHQHQARAKQCVDRCATAERGNAEFGDAQRGDGCGLIRRLVLTALFASYTAFCVSGEVIYVNAPNGLNLRQIPSIESKSIGLLEYGQKVAVVDDEPLNGWLRVEGDNYIKEEYTQASDPFEEMELLGEWRITAYAETGYCCANGNYPTTGYTIACNSLPFGTEVFIEDVGFRTVEDRGPAWLGDAWLDLYLEEYDACVQWGDQKRKVWRVNSDEQSEPYQDIR